MHVVAEAANTAVKRMARKGTKLAVLMVQASTAGATDQSDATFLLMKAYMMLECQQWQELPLSHGCTKLHTESESLVVVCLLVRVRKALFKEIRRIRTLGSVGTRCGSKCPPHSGSALQRYFLEDEEQFVVAAQS